MKKVEFKAPVFSKNTQLMGIHFLLALLAVVAILCFINNINYLNYGIISLVILLLLRLDSLIVQRNQEYLGAFILYLQQQNLKFIYSSSSIYGHLSVVASNEHGLELNFYFESGRFYLREKSDLF